MLYINPDVESSYEENDLGQTLYDLVLQLKPKKIIEFGALNGYSTIAMAMALDELGKGKIHSYDLWDRYPYNHALMGEAMCNVMSYGLGKYVQFHDGNFWTWEVQPFDLFHLDISNDGKILKKAYKKLKGHGPIVFEGGSVQRDNVKWMKGHQPITGCGLDYKIINSKFPSLSLI